MQEKVARTARALGQEGVIDEVARDYLVEWAEGRRPSVLRPSSDPFLQHRWQRLDALRGSQRGPPLHLLLDLYTLLASG